MKTKNKMNMKANIKSLQKKNETCLFFPDKEVH